VLHWRSRCQLNSNVIDVAHIEWLSRDGLPNSTQKARHAEYGRNVEDITGVFSIEKFIQLYGNSTCSENERLPAALHLRRI